MRAIRVTFRAVFRQPIGALNPSGFKVAGPVAVELFGNEKRWQARELSQANVFTRLGRFVSLDHAMTTVESSFQERLEPWQMWGKGPNELTEKLLTPYEVADLGDGKFGWLQDEDRTHILHGPLIDPKAKVPNAACGASVNAKCFISTKANIEPSCRGCKQVWEREYKGK